mmetsp:Transcript_7981/g.29532  ORF Transcript_7981/g.29532 Transcript_7981/m.29532 type:complete len:125 (-) Transcript_7981:4251-4625(-)
MFATSSVISSVGIVRRCSAIKSQRSNKRVTVAMSVQTPQSQVIFKKMIKSSIIASTMSVLPALAIVDDRLNGDGTGLPLGINDGALGTVLATIPLVVFALYYAAGKQDASIIAGGKDDDSGLSL